MQKYLNRTEAGKALVNHLKAYSHQEQTIVLALPRGGVPIAYEISTALSLPLDVFIVRKLGIPEHEELAMGAIASGNTTVFNEEVIQGLHIQKPAINAVIKAEQKELLRRERLYRGNRPFPELLNKTIILVDDGIATGATMFAAIKALRAHHPKKIIAAVPVAAESTCKEMEPLVDQLICPLKPFDFYAVGVWYEEFPQTSDDEVIELLEKSQRT